jgi:ElaB/YqjD/DUF883 family membrane-anchored ribosome-binding protein
VRVDHIIQTEKIMVALPDSKDIVAGAADFAADIAQLKTDLEKLSGSIVGLGRDGLEAAQRGGAKQLGAWRDDVDELATSIKKQGQHQLDVVGGQVRDRPILTLLAAFGVGLLVSRLVDRR